MNPVSRIMVRNKVSSFMEYGIEVGFYVSLYFFVQFPNYPLYFQAFGSCVAILFWMIQSLLERRIVYKYYPWDVWILLLNIWIWLTLIWSIDPGKTILYNLVFTNGSIFMVLFSSTFHRKSQIIRICTFIFILSSYFAIQAVLPTFPAFIKNLTSSASLTDKVFFRTMHMERIKSSMGDSNSVGGLYAVLIALLLPLLLFGFFSPQKVKKSWWIVGGILLGKVILQIVGWLIMGLFFVTLLMSGSRGAMFGLAASVFLMFLIRNRWVSNLTYSLLFFSGLLIPDFRLFLYSLYASVVDGTRYIIFQNSIELIKLVPFTGLGLGNFAKAYWFFFHTQYNHAHNIFLNTAVELGIPGLILFTLLGSCFVYFGCLYTKNKKDPLYYAINMSLSSVVFGFLVRCLVDYTI
jgi:O-antigen ligase